MFQCIVTLLLLMTNNVEALIVYVTSVEALFTLCSVAGLLWMRYTRPKLYRPIKVNYLLPILFLIICSILVIFSCVEHPTEVGVGIAIISLGVPIYFIFIMWENKPQWLRSACNSFNLLCSKTFLCLPENSKELWSLQFCYIRDQNGLMPFLKKKNRTPMLCSIIFVTHVISSWSDV